MTHLHFLWWTIGGAAPGHSLLLVPQLTIQIILNNRGKLSTSNWKTYSELYKWDKQFVFTIDLIYSIQNSCFFRAQRVEIKTLNFYLNNFF